MTNTLLPLLSMPNLSWAAIQDQLDLQKNKDSSGIVAQILNLYQQQTEKNDTLFNVLNIHCGTGNYLLEFAKRGHSVIGVDSDYQNLEAVIVKQLKEGLQSRLFHTKDQSFKNVEEIDLIVGFENAFSELVVNAYEAQRVLGHLRKMIKNYGMIVIETSYPVQPFMQQILLNAELPVDIQIDVNEYENDKTLIDEVTTLSLTNNGESFTTQRKRRLRLWVSNTLVSLLIESGFENVCEITLLGRTFVVGQNINL